MKRKIKWKMRKDKILICVIVLSSCITYLDSAPTSANKIEQNLSLQMVNNNATKLGFTNSTLSKVKLVEYYKNVLDMGQNNSYKAETINSGNIKAKLFPVIDIEIFTKKVCHSWKKYRPSKIVKEKSLLKWIVNKSENLQIHNSQNPVASTPEEQPGGDLPAGCYFKNNDIQTSEVICSGKQMNKVPLFKLRHFDKLIFENTSIQIVDKSVVKGLPMVSELTFFNGDLMAVDFRDLLKAQPVLKKLSIVHNCISTVSFSSFSIPKQQDQDLTELNFQNNMIIFLPEPATDNDSTLPKLQSLNFNYNPMYVLTGDIFLPLRNSLVKNLFLKKCSIEEIGSPTLKNSSSPLLYLPHLETLDLSSNPHLTPLRLKKLLLPLRSRNLISLDLSSNFYIEVPTDALIHVQFTLEILNLEYLSVRCLDGHSFPVMPKLTSLNLQNSRISQIKVDTFNSLASLEVLLLDGNDLLTIPCGMSMSQLKVLSLSNNPSTSFVNSRDESFKITNDTFCKFGSLEKLNLANVPLRRIDNFIFRGLSSLVNLSLSQSSLLDIESYSFRDLGMLKSLDLSFNEISTLPEDIFFGLSNLTFIDLSHNEISFNMDIPPIKHIKTYPSNITPNMSTTSSKSGDAKWLFNGTPSLKVLNISSNQLNFLVPGMFDKLYHLNILELGYNHIMSWDVPIFYQNIHLTLVVLNNNEIRRLTDSMISDFDKNNLTVVLEENVFFCTCPLTAFYDELNDTNFTGLDEYECFNGTSTMLLEDYFESFADKNCSRKYHLYSIGPSVVPEILIYDSKAILYGAIAVICFIIVIVLTTISYKTRWCARYWIYKVKLKLNKHDTSDDDPKVYKYDAFVSYAKDDQDWVFENLVHNLESSSSKFHIGLHERDFIVGEPITHNIMYFVEQSRKVIVVISKSYLASHWCMAELYLATNNITDDRKNKLILLYLEPIAINKQPKALRTILKTRTYIAWNQEPEAQKLFWTRMKRAIGKPISQKDTNKSESSEQISKIENSATSELEQESCENSSNTMIDRTDDMYSLSSGYSNQSYVSTETLSAENLSKFVQVNNKHVKASTFEFD